ncbi:hypothetical protein N9934_01200 [Desulfosarcina sp.]|nr:hypothetical protein [Desulfosarcina sp.]
MQRQHYLFLIISLLILVGGLVCQYWASSFNYNFSTISTVKDNKILQREQITVPTQARILQLMAVGLNTLAISIFISAFVVSNLEAKQKEALNKEIFSAVFKRFIPDAVFDSFKRDILSSELVSENGHLEYTFNLSSSGAISVVQSYSHTIRNITAREVSDPQSRLTPTPNTKSLVLQRTKWKIADKTVVDYELGNPEKKLGVKIESERSDEFLLYDVKIPPMETATATITISCEFKHEAFAAFFTNRPLTGLSISAHFPEGYDFRLFPCWSATSEEIDSGPNVKRYMVKGAILPKQGFLFFLNKKNSSALQQGDGQVPSEAMLNISEENSL